MAETRNPNSTFPKTQEADEVFFSNYDIHLFKEGNHFKLYEKMGTHPIDFNGLKGVKFSVWAPNAERVSVVGDFNQWNKLANPLKNREDSSGIWEGFIPDTGKSNVYKYHIWSKHDGYEVDKSDPYAFYAEVSPRTASIVWSLDYQWGDQTWMRERKKINPFSSPLSIYEVHLGSWRRDLEGGNRFLNYRQIAPLLADYVKQMGFTHIELLPVMEHPFYGSWGYQVVGYFSPTSRYGNPQDFMYFMDYMHQQGIGVILDWVPSHFPTDEHGLVYFDGTHLYGHSDPRKGYHPDWKSRIFNHGRNEVSEFLINSAVFWLDKYHVDGLRVDAVASMLYLDYSRRDGEWIANEYGGRENLESINFLKKFNEVVYKNHPGVQTIAEESTAWPMVSKPTYIGGLGFGMKWNMGWMNDTLKYFSYEPVHRKYHHDEITFSLWYSFSENFILVNSHDEVVHGKGSLTGKMPGDDWRKLANTRLFLGYMYAHPGKKLLFMGSEFGQWREWNHEESLDWHLLGYPLHKGIQLWTKDLNSLYTAEPALHELDFDSGGFEWIDFSDSEFGVISFLRKDKASKNYILIICNFTPVPRYNYKVGSPFPGHWQELLNSDAAEYGGSGCGNSGKTIAENTPCHGRTYSFSLTLPPLGILFLKKS